jgi:hypothetical protein
MLFQPMEEKNLSQKMSQLSTSATDTKESLLMMKDIKDEIEKKIQNI